MARNQPRFSLWVKKEGSSRGGGGVVHRDPPPRTPLGGETGVSGVISGSLRGARAAGKPALDQTPPSTPHALPFSLGGAAGGPPGWWVQLSEWGNSRENGAISASNFRPSSRII